MSNEVMRAIGYAAAAAPPTQPFPVGDREVRGGRAADQPWQEGSLRERIHAARQALEVLGNLGAALEDRLSPIISPLAPEAGRIAAPAHSTSAAREPQRPPQCDLALQVDSLGRGIVEIAHRLDRLMSRLEV